MYAYIESRSLRMLYGVCWCMVYVKLYKLDIGQECVALYRLSRQAVSGLKVVLYKKKNDFICMVTL